MVWRYACGKDKREHGEHVLEGCGMLLTLAGLLFPAVINMLVHDH